jgi:hypothetical protein
MEIQRINRDDPERIFMSFKNSYSTASITPGQWVAHDVVTDQDGVGVTKPGGQARSTIAGVANHTIAHNGFGLVQVWGYRADARCVGGTGSATSKLSVGTPMYFRTSGFAAHGLGSGISETFNTRKVCGFSIVPANTAAIVTQAGTSGAYKVMINCL